MHCLIGSFGSRDQGEIASTLAVGGIEKQGTHRLDAERPQKEQNGDMPTVKKIGYVDAYTFISDVLSEQ